MLDFPGFSYKYMLRAYLVYQTLEKEMIPIIYNIFQRTEAECTLHNSFYEANISILMSKLKKDITRNYKKESSMTISFININENFLNKITSKLNWLIYKNDYYLMANLVLFQEDKIGLTLVESVNGIYICVLKGKNQASQMMVKSTW